MKFFRLATITALSTTVFAGGTTAVLAAERQSAPTDGNITFTPNNTDEIDVLPPEAEPDVDIKPEDPGITGPLSIVKAATMNFGKQVISNKDETYNMIAEMQPLKTPLEDGTSEVPYVSFAQVQDLRGTNVGWNLEVSLTEFTAETETHNRTLKGAEIIFVDSRIQYEGNTQTNAPTAHEAGEKLAPGGKLSVMKAEKGQGAGASSVVWGNQQELNAQLDAEKEIVENEAIKLFVPGKTAKDAVTYKSTLTWNLSATPGDDAGEVI